MRLKIYIYRSYTTLIPLGRFPSIASFLLRQSAHRKGPCQGFELVEKMAPAWTEMPSLGARSTWHIAHTKKPDVNWPVGSSFPNLQNRWERLWYSSTINNRKFIRKYSHDERLSHGYKASNWTAIPTSKLNVSERHSYITAKVLNQLNLTVLFQGSQQIKQQKN